MTSETIDSIRGKYDALSKEIDRLNSIIQEYNRQLELLILKKEKVDMERSKFYINVYKPAIIKQQRDKDVCVD